MRKRGRKDSIGPGDIHAHARKKKRIRSNVEGNDLTLSIHVKGYPPMPWTTLKFGKHTGKSLPQVLFTDPDWFFWSLENDIFKGPLAGEAELLGMRARNIKIPSIHGANMQAEYIVHPSVGKFSHMELVPRDRPKHEGASPTFRSDMIDLSVPRQIAIYDKLGCSNLLLSVKFILFGDKKARMTRNRCDAFFNNPANFNIK